MKSSAKLHLVFLSVIILTSVLVNIASWALSGIPPTQQLSSDAELHLVHWYKDSARYAANFARDTSFNFDVQPAGELFVNKTIVRFADFFKIDLAWLSVAISFLSVFIFLIGVYTLAYFVLRKEYLAFAVGLGSVIPTFALGGTFWGFLATGFLPRESALALLVWLIFLLLYAKKTGSNRLKYSVFLIMGLLANWYPVLFFHFMAVYVLASIIYWRRITRELVLSGLVFVAGSAFAIWDILAKAATTIPPNLNILHIRFEYMYIFSLEYGIFHYLRRPLIYGIFAIALFLLAKKFLKYKVSDEMRFWRAIWISSAAISVVGIFIEQFTVYAKFLFSRTSLFFILATMLVSAELAVLLFERFFPNLRFKKTALTVILFLIFFGQSAIPTVYRSVRSANINSGERKEFMTAMTALEKHTLPGDIVLANTGYANRIRDYAFRGTYCSWKEGTVSLLDGKGGTQWYDRFTKTNEVLASENLNTMLDFSRKNGINAIFIENKNIPSNAKIPKSVQLFQSGSYDIFVIK